MIQNFSQEFIDIINSQGRTFATKVVINEVEYMQLRNVEVTRGMESSDTIVLGSTYSSKLSFELSTPFIEIPKKTRVELKVALKIDNNRFTFDEYEDPRVYTWFDFGIFYIDESTWENNILNIVAYDIFSFLNMDYDTNLTNKQSISTIVSDFERYGVIATSEAKAFNEMYDVSYLKNHTVREAIGFIASYLGRQAVINSNGELEFKTYNQIDYTIDENVVSRLPLVKTETVGAVHWSCEVATTDEEGNEAIETQTITKGVGNPIFIDNQSYDETKHQELLNMYSGFEVVNTTVDIILGNPLLEVGDIANCHDVHGNTFKLPIMEQTLKFNGGCQSTISSKFRVVEESTEVKGQMEKYVDRVYGQVLKQYSEIIKNANEISMRVVKDNIIAEINLSTEKKSDGSLLKLLADKIELEGLVTANGNFKILEDGSMEARNGKFRGTFVSGTGDYRLDFTKGGKLTIRKVDDDGLTYTFNFNGTTLAIPRLEVMHTVVTSGDTSNSYISNVNGHVRLSAFENEVMLYTGMTNTDGTHNQCVAPNGDGAIKLGTASHKWGQFYSSIGSISTSDINLKRNINGIDERYMNLIRELKPHTYMFKGENHDRVHSGFIAQEVKSLMDKHGITDKELGAWCNDPKYNIELVETVDENGEKHVEEKTTIVNGEYEQSLRYEEFIALVLALAQENAEIIKQQQNRINDLESRLLQIEQQLGGK